VTYRTTEWRDKAECRHFQNFTDWPTRQQLLLCGDCRVTIECAQLGLESYRTVKDALDGAVHGGLKPVELAAMVRLRNQQGVVQL
jgi:hypothetical protein